MFARLLNKGFRGSLVLIISLLGLLFLLQFFAGRAIEQEFYPNLFYNYFTQFVQSKWAITLLNLSFVGLGLILVSLLTVNQEISDKQNYFPVFLYLIITATCINPLQVNSQALTNVFILFAIFRLLQTYRRDDGLSEIYSAAFWLSVSSFITISSIISFPLFFIVLTILRPFHWRDWVIALIGFITPIFMYECLAYLSNFNQWYLFDALGQFFAGMHVPSFSEYYLPLALALLILLLISIFQSLLQGFGNTVKRQRAKSILLWLIFFSLFAVFSSGANSSSILLIYAIPFSFFIGDFLFQLRQIKITNTLLAIIMLCSALVILAEFSLL